MGNIEGERLAKQGDAHPLVEPMVHLLLLWLMATGHCPHPWVDEWPIFVQLGGGSAFVFCIPSLPYLSIGQGEGCMSPAESIENTPRNTLHDMVRTVDCKADTYLDITGDRISDKLDSRDQKAARQEQAHGYLR